MFSVLTTLQKHVSDTEKVAVPSLASFLGNKNKTHWRTPTTHTHTHISIYGHVTTCVVMIVGLIVVMIVGLTGRLAKPYKIRVPGDGDFFSVPSENQRIYSVIDIVDGAIHGSNNSNEYVVPCNEVFDKLRSPLRTHGHHALSLSLSPPSLPHSLSVCIS